MIKTVHDFQLYDTINYGGHEFTITHIREKFIHNAAHGNGINVDCLDSEGSLRRGYLFVDAYLKPQAADYNKLSLLKRMAKEEDIAKLKEEINIAEIRNMYWGGSSLGSDPEIFLVDSKTQELIPAFEFLPNEKSPIKTTSGETLFWDGFQAEFNVNPGSCLDSRVNSMRSGLIGLLSEAKKKFPNAQLTLQSTVDINPDLFKRAKPEHIAFGCSPSLNVYDMQGIKLPGEAVPFRSAGGHIHFGLNPRQKEDVVEYVKALDKILGVACVSLFANYDNPIRRQMYGLAGEYRTPNHGLEYRTLSNAWLCHPTIMYIVNDLARLAIAMVQYGHIDKWKATTEEVIECINNCNVKLAREILTRNEDLFKNILAAMCYRNDDKIDVVYHTFMNGMEVLVNPQTIEKNWNIGEAFYYGQYQICSMNYENSQKFHNFHKILKEIRGK